MKFDPCANVLQVLCFGAFLSLRRFWRLQQNILTLLNILKEKKKKKGKTRQETLPKKFNAKLLGFHVVTNRTSAEAIDTTYKPLSSQ